MDPGGRKERWTQGILESVSHTPRLQCLRYTGNSSPHWQVDADWGQAVSALGDCMLRIKSHIARKKGLDGSWSSGCRPRSWMGEVLPGNFTWRIILMLREMPQRSITTFLGCEAWLCSRHLLSEVTMRHQSESPSQTTAWLPEVFNLVGTWGDVSKLVKQIREGCVPGQRCECWKRSQEGRRWKIGGLSDGRQPGSHCVRCKLPWATVCKRGSGKTHALVASLSSATCSVTAGSTAPTQSHSSCLWCLSRAFSSLAKVSEWEGSLMQFVKMIDTFQPEVQGRGCLHSRWGRKNDL